jgi:hypothetical protein
MNYQKTKFEYFADHAVSVEPNSVFVEIGGERGEGSTAYLSKWAQQLGTHLISVDIDTVDRKKQVLINKLWQDFYLVVRDSSWPQMTSHINQLPKNLQKECVDVHEWAKIQQEFLKNFDFADNIVNVCAVGSTWSQSYGTNHGQPISLLYLDNFDYIWDVASVPSFIQDQIQDYAQTHDISMNNQNCQVEHLTQLINLYPYLAQQCLVGFDDTYRYNNCWVGKSGPGVVFLLSKGWKILHYSNGFVIMRQT